MFSLKKMMFLILACGCMISCEKKYFGPKYDIETWKATDNLGNNFEKKYQIKFLNSGLGDLVDSKNVIWAMSLTSEKKMDVNEGKKLAQLMIENFLKEFNENPVYINYVNISNERSSILKKVFNNSKIGFKLAFWDENVDRPLYPYLAQIRFADEKVYFYYADEKTQALKEPPTVISMYDLLDKDLQKNSN